MKLLRLILRFPVALLEAPGKLSGLLHLIHEVKAITDSVELLMGPGTPGKKAAALELAGRLYDAGALTYPKRAGLSRAEFLAMVSEVIDGVVALHNLAGRYIHAKGA